jgi:hypothetical protein
MEEVKLIQVKASDKVKDIAFKVIQTAIDNTKVDTSRAISNWQISVGKEENNLKKAYYYGFAGSTKEQSRLTTLVHANDALRDKKIGESVFITNDVDNPESSEKALNTYDDRIDKTNLPYLERSRVLEAQSQAYTEGLILAETANLLASDG